MLPHTEATELPAPQPDALAHSEQLLDRILAAIDAAGGAVGFAQFLEMALYEPGYGYYSAGSAKFGAQGDFVTAADLGDFLARAIVRTLAPRLQAVSQPVLVELGAGSGALCEAILEQLDAQALSHVRYRILEPSADLRARQRQRLADVAQGRVEWIDTLAPDSVSGAILANEVADALPFERIALGPDGWQQLAVARDGRALRWQPRALPQSLLAHLQRVLEALPEAPAVGYRTELRPLLAPWVATIAAAIRVGDALIIDYGLARHEYFHPQRSDGTVMCHYRHRAHGNPFLWPGLQDITAWVDFSECASAAKAAGLAVTGYATQGSWIAETVLAGDASLNLDVRAASQLKTLLLPGEMGERFKVMQLSRDAAEAPVLRGRDMRARL